MRKLKPFVPSAVALVAAVFVSAVLIEDTVVLLWCLAVALITPAVAVVRCMHARRSRWRVLLLTIAPAALFLVLTWSHIPLRLVFRLYRPEFDRAAAQVDAGNPPATPFWIGPFRIRMAGRRNPTGPPYLASNRDPYEIEGFVRHPEGRGFNLWSCIALDDAWSYVQED